MIDVCVSREYQLHIMGPVADAGFPLFFLCAASSFVLFSPAGALAIAGIHFFPLWLWLYRSQHHDKLPWLSILPVGGVLALGRFIGMAVEIWVLWTHCLGLLSVDVERHLSKKQ